ncbi:zinc finger protein 862-like [Saccoglossus kowalevskii]|uniref:Zinc finger protein 862-like n=1 Tax=Saccoglossus kowalevskii TaxID=10224 RepID=A0ABM0M0C7_SACKO|nr:PREDICTED: zinc finger protein 862-like [Saccoglossus kowalevskii]
MYLRVFDDGRPTTKYFSLQALERADSKGMLTSIDAAFDKEFQIDAQTWKEKLVGFGADGAAVNFGQRQGVSAKLRADIPHLVSVHCVAHRLELAIKHALEQCKYFKEIEDFLVNIFKFYKNSPLNWSNLQLAGETTNVKVYKPSNVLGTRWIGHHERAIINITKNYSAMFTHLDQVTITGQSIDAKNKAKGFCRKLQFYRFTKSLYVMMDIYTVLSRLSLMFQKNDSSVETVDTCFQAALSNLRELRENPGPREMEFNNHITIDNDDIKFLDVTCRAERGGTLTQQEYDEMVNRDKMTLIQNTIDQLEVRFTSFSDNQVLNGCKVINQRNWPIDNVGDLLEYGQIEIQQLITHFQDLLIRRSCKINDIPLEWRQLKLILRDTAITQPHLTYLDFWQRLLRHMPEEFVNILTLVKIVLLIPIHTSECERGFSIMGKIKTDWRSSLTTEKLNELLRIKLLGQPLHKFNPQPAIMTWWNAVGVHEDQILAIWTTCTNESDTDTDL